jgi:hypothetical protein
MRHRGSQAIGPGEWFDYLVDGRGLATAGAGAKRNRCDPRTADAVIACALER